MTVAETSRVRYEELLKSGELSRQQAELLAYMRPGIDYTRAELSHLTDMPINCVTGRVNELLDSGKLSEEAGEKRTCKVTGYTAKVVRLATEFN